VASGAPRGAQRTAAPTRALGASRIACGSAGARGGASTVGLLAAGPAGPRRTSRDNLRIRVN